jgi:hypothetical protein
LLAEAFSYRLESRDTKTFETRPGFSFVADSLTDEVKVGAQVRTDVEY